VEHAVIMAGGAGTRLWPLSRGNRPKYLLRLFQGRSLLRQSYERLAARFTPDRVHVVTTVEHLPLVTEELPEVPADHLIGEPCGRDTANAIGLAAALLDRRDPHAVMGVFAADQIIAPIERFSDALDRAYQYVADHPETLVTFGIRPASAHTGYGYVQRGRPIGEGIYEAAAFREKPDAATAARYVAGGQHYWNSGMFVWRASTYLEELARHLPDSHAKLTEIAHGWSEPDGRGRAEAVYPTLTKISVDFAVMEKARRVVVVEMDCQWLDVGSWTALAEVVKPDASGNVPVAERAVTLNAAGNIIVAEDDHLLALIGVEDLIVVRSRDATLVCRKDAAQQIKDLVKLLEDQHGDRYV